MEVTKALQVVGRAQAAVNRAVENRDAAIIAARAAGASFREIADRAGLAHETVRRIVNGAEARIKD